MVNKMICYVFHLKKVETYPKVVCDELYCKKIQINLPKTKILEEK